MIELVECKYCKILKPSNQYSTAGIINGKRYYRRRCNSCYRLVKNAKYKRIKELVKEIKKTLKCGKCGFNDFRGLQFHHIDKKNKFKEISNMLAYHSIKLIKEEITKCEILCANCHQIHHYNERNPE